MTDSNGNALRVLVADDDNAVLKLIESVLEKEGYAATTAKDGKEAYKFLQLDQPYAAAILNLVMPHIEGRELVRYMKSERRLMRIPVIMMTADSSPKLMSESLSSGAAGVLPKPFSETQLKTMLRTFVKPVSS